MKRYLAAAAIGLAIFAPAASATPEVRITQYSNVIMGSIDLEEVVDVVVTLDGHDVNITTNETGHWIAVMPVGVSSFGQSLTVAWQDSTGERAIAVGSGTDLLPYMQPSVNAAGSELTVDMSSVDGAYTCSSITYEVRRGHTLRTSGTVPGSGKACTAATLSPAIDPAQDRLVMKSTLTAGDAVVKATMPGAVPGGSGVYGGAPECVAGFGLAQNLACRGVPTAGYAAVRERTGASEVSAPLTPSGAPGLTTAAEVPGGFAAGDRFEVRNGSLAVITRPVTALRADVIHGSTISGECGGVRVGAGPQSGACSNGGFSFSYVNESCDNFFVPCTDLDSPLFVSAVDPVTSTITATAVPVLTTLSPPDHDSVAGGEVLFFADATRAATFFTEAEDTISAVGVELRPAGGGSVVASGDGANTPAGARVSDVPAGRYDVHWTLTDSHGNTMRRTTDLIVQPRERSDTSTPAGGGTGTVGAEAGPGPQQPPAEPQAPAGGDASVTCRVKGKARRKVTCKAGPAFAAGATRARLLRRGKTVARGISLAGRITLKSRRRLGRGRYTLVVGNVRIKIRL